MIRISLTWLLTSYLLAFVVLVVGLWLAIEWRRQARRRKARKKVLQCQTCGLEFLDPSNDLLCRCPRCGSLNERIQRLAL